MSAKSKIGSSTKIGGAKASPITSTTGTAGTSSAAKFGGANQAKPQKAGTKSR